MCQFVDVSNQMATTGEVSNIERIFSCNRALYKFFCSTFDTSPVSLIWLEMYTNWHKKSQGPNKKCVYFSKGRIHSCSMDTTRYKGSFTSMALWTVNPFFPQVYLQINFHRVNIMLCWPKQVHYETYVHRYSFIKILLWKIY